MIEQKANDWLASLFFSPDKSPQDLADFGVTVENSSLQDIEYYKQIPEIKEAFRTEQGAFDEAGFSKYYQGVLQLYNDAANTQVIGDITNTYSYDELDFLSARPKNSKPRANKPSLAIVANPERRARGAEDVLFSSAPTISAREIAQQNPVFNTETNSFEEVTPNDFKLWEFFNPNKETYVLATYDEDGFHDINGRTVAHKKGDYKLNEYGEPYYETLGGRSTAGKTLLHISDVLTTDGSAWNKYDFFDSDGLSKSLTGTIFKTAANVGAIFLPFNAGKIYGGIRAVTELGKALPLLYKGIADLATWDTDSSNEHETANVIRGYFSRFDGSVSDAGQQGFFTLENIGKVIVDSSGQLIQQRVVSEIPLWLSKLRGMKHISDSTMRWGRELSNFYMSATSAAESYDAFKEAGASNLTAGLGMWATFGAFSAAFRSDYWRDMWYKGTYLDNTKVRNTVKNAAQQLLNGDNALLPKIANSASKEASANWMRTAQNWLTSQFSKLKPGDLIHDSLNEGLEETMEEVFQDAIKGGISALHAVGIIDRDLELDFGFSVKDMLNRYFTSAVGGAIGGSVFNLAGRYFDRNSPELSKVIASDDALGELVYLARENKTDQVKKEILRLHKAGRLGSTVLSGENIQYVKDGVSGTWQYLPAQEGDSQNDMLKTLMLNYVDRVEQIVKEEGLNLTDEQLAKILADPEVREELEGFSEEDAKSLLKRQHSSVSFQQIEDLVLKNGHHTSICSDWQQLTQDIVATKADMEAMLAPEANEPKTDKDIEERIKNIQKTPEYKVLEKRLKEFRDQRKEMLSGKNNHFYADQLFYIANPFHAGAEKSLMGIHNFSRYVYHKDYDTIDEWTKQRIDAAYTEYTNKTEKNRVLREHRLFYNFVENVSDKLLETSDLFSKRNVLLGNSTELQTRLKDAAKELVEMGELRDKALSEFEEDSEEVKKATQDFKLAQDRYNDLSKTWGLFGGFLTTLTEKGSEYLHRPENLDTLTNEELAEYANSYLKYREYIQNEGFTLDSDDTDYQFILDLWKNKFLQNVETDYESLENYSNEIANRLGVDGFSVQDMLATIIRTSSFAELSKYLELYEDGTEFRNNGLEFLSQYGSWADTVAKILQSAPFNIVEFIHKLNAYNVNESPAYDILQTASNISGVNNWKVIEVLKQYKNQVLTANDPNTWTITDPNAVNMLKNTREVLQMLYETINRSISNVNSVVNYYRQQHGLKPLATLPTRNAWNLQQDLLRIHSNIEHLLLIHEANEAQALEQHKEIARVSRMKLFNKLRDLSQPFNSVFGVNITELLNQFGLSGTVATSLEDFQAVEAKIIDFETALYSAVRSSVASYDELIEKLLDEQFGWDWNEIVKAAPSRFNSDSNSPITDYDFVMYVARIMSAPTKQFFKETIPILGDPSYNKAPIFSQEYAAQLIYSRAMSDKIFSKVLLAMKKKLSQSNDVYLRSKTVLTNTTVVYGGAGTGKSSGVALLTTKLFPEAQIACVAPTEVLCSNLKVNLGNENLTTSTRSDFIKAIVGEHDLNAYADVITEDGKVVITATLNNSFVPTDYNPFEENASFKILVVDEASLYTRLEWEAIDRWAQKHGIFVVGLGDYMQSAVESTITYNGETVTYQSGLEDCIFCKTPDLIVPLRTENQAKFNNYIQLRTALENAWQVYFNNPAEGIPKMVAQLESYLTNNPINFEYVESDNDFVGSRFVSSQSTEKAKALEKLCTIAKASNKRVCIIADDLNSYRPYKEKYKGVVEILTPYNVQGSEFDYAFLDIGRGANTFQITTALYTLTQRSKKGTMIVRNMNAGFFKDHTSPTGALPLTISSEQIERYKNWRLEGLKLLSFEEDAEYIHEFSEEPAALPEPEAPQTPVVVTAPTVTSPTTTEALEQHMQEKSVQKVKDDELKTHKDYSQIYSTQYFSRCIKEAADSKELKKYLPKNCSKEALKVARAYFLTNKHLDKVDVFTRISSLSSAVVDSTPRGELRTLLSNDSYVASRPIGNHWYLCGITEYKDGNTVKEYRIPLLVLTGHKADSKAFQNTKYTGRILLKRADLLTNAKDWWAVKSEPTNYGWYSTPIVLTDGLSNEDNIIDHTQQFIERNKGKSFVFYTDDPWNIGTNNIDKTVLTPERDGDNSIKWAVSHHIQLVATQSRYTEPSQWLKSIKALTTVNFKRRYKNQRADFNKEVAPYKLVPSSLTKLMPIIYEALPANEKTNFSKYFTEQCSNYIKNSQKKQGVLATLNGGNINADEKLIPEKIDFTKPFYYYNLHSDLCYYLNNYLRGIKNKDTFYKSLDSKFKELAPKSGLGFGIFANITHQGDYNTNNLFIRGKGKSEAILKSKYNGGVYVLEKSGWGEEGASSALEAETPVQNVLREKVRTKKVDNTTDLLSKVKQVYTAQTGQDAKVTRHFQTLSDSKVKIGRVGTRGVTFDDNTTLWVSDSLGNSITLYDQPELLKIYKEMRDNHQGDENVNRLITKIVAMDTFTEDEINEILNVKSENSSLAALATEWALFIHNNQLC